MAGGEGEPELEADGAAWVKAHWLSQSIRKVGREFFVFFFAQLRCMTATTQGKDHNRALCDYLFP
jgi:hypothetical protein